MQNLPLIRKRLKVASMKVPCSAQIVLLHYKTPEILKRSGLPLYDAQKRHEIPVYELAKT
jgi:hypothetical protein